jgi:hypothetical protein
VICEDPSYIWDWFLFMLSTQPDKLDDIWEASASNLNAPIPYEPNCHCHMTLFAFIRMGLGLQALSAVGKLVWFLQSHLHCMGTSLPPSLRPLSLKHMVLIVNVSSSGDYQLLTTFCCCCCCCFPYAPSGLLFKRQQLCLRVLQLIPLTMLHLLCHHWLESWD